MLRSIAKMKDCSRSQAHSYVR